MSKRQTDVSLHLRVWASHGVNKQPRCVVKHIYGATACMDTAWALSSLPRSGDIGGGSVPQRGGGIRPQRQGKEIGLLLGVINGGISKSCFLSFKERHMSKPAFVKDDPACRVDNGSEVRRLE